MRSGNLISQEMKDALPQQIKFIWELLNQIPDPEVPAISIVELGVVRKVEKINGRLLISITPTYTGCPALKAMEESIRESLVANEVLDFDIKTILFPAWTTDWITEEARQKLKEYGIAPPQMTTEEHLKAMMSGYKNRVTCPYCNATDTRLTSAFGSTACKALHYCNSCQQPFEEFKCH